MAESRVSTVVVEGRSPVDRREPERANLDRGRRWMIPPRTEPARATCFVQSIGCAVAEVTPGDYFELIARQTSGATKNAAADELTWFAIEVVE